MECTAAGNGSWESWVAEQARLHGRLLFRVAYGVLKDAARAEDVCQDVIVKALQMEGAIRNPVALKSWMARVAINQSLLVRRREQCAQRAHQAVSRLPDKSPSWVDRQEVRESLESALEDLPQPTQAVVVLRLLQGLSGNEVKDLLDMSASDVSRKLHEGMAFLRRRLRAAHGLE